ncbi:Hypothetical predicted protein [Mytilus galloprovincialis]|uniref:Uncharacterized protein n=1 Tax=Mytilus galloprovincialis TaxID=29158 RepID=A0A8B6GG05_MYTGA|nr:Hypothetical predicted protein [Mytilus galloprovincialis]
MKRFCFLFCILFFTLGAFSDPIKIDGRHAIYKRAVGELGALKIMPVPGDRGTGFGLGAIDPDESDEDKQQ